MFALTPRLLLRPGWPEDAPALARAIGHEAVATKLSHVPWPYTEEDARAFLDQAWREPAPVFLIAERGGPLIGGIGLHEEGGEPALGYWLTPDAWGCGYATEAGRAVLAIARDALRLPRLRASAFVGNDASTRVLAKLGFRPTGRIVRRPCLALGLEVDAVEAAVELDDAPTGSVDVALAA